MNHWWPWFRSAVFVALAGFMCFGACQAQTHSQKFNMLAGGAFAGIEKQGYQCEVIHKQSRFENLYREIQKNRLTPPPIPEVNFQLHAVLFFSLDTRPTAGNSVDIEKIVRNQGRLEVLLRVTEPPKDSLQAQVLTRPYVMATVEQTPGIQSVRFIGDESKQLCVTNW